MSNLSATYNNATKNKVIEIPLDMTKTLTEHIIDLKEQVNTFLTQTLEDEKQSKVTTVEEDEIEKQKQEEQSDEDSPITADKPEFSEEQASKKQKTDA